MASFRFADINSWRRIRTTLLVLSAIVGSSAVFALAALYIGGHCEPFLNVARPPDGSEAIAAIPMEYALNSTEYNDVIFLGDSAPLYAIDPVYFEELTGLKAYNLASFRPVSVNGYLLAAEAYLSRHPAPRVIVLCVSPEVPGSSDVERVFAKRFVRVYGHELAGKSPTVDAIVNSVVAGDGYDVLIKRGASIMRDYAAKTFMAHSHDFRDDRIPGSIKDTYNTFSRRLGENRGYIKPTELHGPPAAPQYAGVHFAIRPEWDRAMRALIDLADAAGVRLMIRLAPARSDARVENFEEITRGLQKFQKEFPRFSVQPAVYFYDTALCYDLWHLNSVGAKKFTRILAQDVRALLGEPPRTAQQLRAVERSP